MSPIETKTLNETTRQAHETTTLSPRFYTTDAHAMDRLGVDAIRPEWEALMAEFEVDRNRYHFERGEDWDFNPAGLSDELRSELLDFFVSSLTAEFSGCVLYAELRKKGSNDDLKRLFKYMARDEARHAGFINKCLGDFGMKVDMSFLVESKDYTYFSPKFILYATYLSEKIGYARYITIYRHLQRHPENRFHPIFNWFEEWCNDEFRHGEALALMMRANPELLRGRNRLWIKFFQLAVFVTMFVRDHARPAFHDALGIDPEEFGMTVFQITRDISRQVFPLLLDVDDPAFLARLRRVRDLSQRIASAKAGGLLGHLRALPLQLAVGVIFLRMLAAPAKKNPLPEQLRVAAAW